MRKKSLPFYGKIQIPWVKQLYRDLEETGSVVEVKVLTVKKPENVISEEEMERRNQRMKGFWWKTFVCRL